MVSPPPLVLDIDGTLTRPSGGIDPRVFEPLAAWSAPVVLATGKAFPYPVALCHFMAIPERVIAENGGVVCIDETVELVAPSDWIPAFVDALEAADVSLGWGGADLVNRWRETEVAVRRDVPRERIQAVADRFDLEVLDSGYAYHVKHPAVSKGLGVERASDLLGFEPGDAVAIGDSENDASMFDVVGRAIAVDNADAAAKTAADEVLDRGYADGTLAALSRWSDT